MSDLNPTNPSDGSTSEHLLRQLADLDEHSVQPADSTLQNLHRELETLALAVRQPAPAMPYAEEAGCREVLEQSKALAWTTGTLTISEATTDPMPSPKPRRSLPPGTEIGPYRLEEKLGEGGMGAVYRTTHTRLDKTVAVKVLPASRMEQPDAVVRFQREMKAVGRIDHPHLVRALDAGEAGGIHYLAMEFVTGIDLAQLIRSRGPLPANAACELIRQAALGLQAAHAHGMIHRDIKPANLMLARQEYGPPVVKVLDLGLALLDQKPSPEAETGLSGLTGLGQIMGTLDNMAPEQAGNSHQVDHRVDLYSLGATLHTLLTGQSLWPEWKGQPLLKKLQQLATRSPRDIRELRPDVPEKVAAVLRRLLQHNPALRYANMGELIAALTPLTAGANLDSLLAGSTEDTADLSPAGPPAKSPSTSRNPRRWRPVAALLLAVLLPVTGLLGGTLLRYVTNQGQLVIEISDPHLEITVINNGVQVHEKVLDRTFTLAAGKGEIQVYAKNGVRLTTRPFELARGGETTLTFPLEDLGLNSDLTLEDLSLESDRTAAEYVLSSGGTVQIHRQDETLTFTRVAQLPHEPFRLTGVLLDGNPKINDAGLEVFQNCRHLTSLSLAKTKVTNAGLRHFADCKDLTSLNLMETQVTDSGLQHFQHAAGLASLNLNATQVGDTGLASLQFSPELWELQLAGTRITIASLVRFQHCPRLTVLNLNGCSIQDSNLGVFRGVDQLQVLDLGHTAISDAGLKLLPDCSRLTALNLDHLSVTDEGLSRFQGCTNLIGLQLSSTLATSAGLKFLGNCPDLKYLELRHTKAGDDCLAQLRNCPQLDYLGLDATTVTDQGLRELVACPRLRHIKLRSSGVTHAGIHRLQQALPGCRVDWNGGTYDPKTPVIVVTPVVASVQRIDSQDAPWTEIPDQLRGATVFMYGPSTDDAGTGRLALRMEADARIGIAVSWQNDGPLDNKLKSAILTPEELQEQGWQESGQVVRKLPDDQTGDLHTVYFKDFKQGQTAYLRTRKYNAPHLLILPSAEQHAPQP